MSRATSRVPTFASRAVPVFWAQPPAVWRAAASARATPAGEGSRRSVPRWESCSAAVRQWIAGVLAPIPRGSNPTRSKRRATSVPSIRIASCEEISTPDAPGPPGLTSSEPMRCVGSVALSREIASWAVGPCGFA